MKAATKKYFTPNIKKQHYLIICCDEKNVVVGGFTHSLSQIETLFNNLCSCQNDSLAGIIEYLYMNNVHYHQRPRKGNFCVVTGYLAQHSGAVDIFMNIYDPKTFSLEILDKMFMQDACIFSSGLLNHPSIENIAVYHGFTTPN